MCWEETWVCIWIRILCGHAKRKRNELGPPPTPLGPVRADLTGIAADDRLMTTSCCDVGTPPLNGTVAQTPITTLFYKFPISLPHHSTLVTAHVERATLLLAPTGSPLAPKSSIPALQDSHNIIPREIQ